MDGDTVIAIIAALAAVGAVFYGRGEVQQARRAAHAAEEQTKIQRQLRIDAAQPYVWADIRPDDATGFLLNVLVGNSGPTVAEKVRVKFDPPLPTMDRADDGVKTAQAILADGIESLPPGRVLQWYLGSAPNLMDGTKVPQAYKVTITGRGPFGTLPALTYIVDMSNWRQTLDRPSGNLHQLTKAVKELPKKIAAAQKGMASTSQGGGHAWQGGSKERVMEAIESLGGGGTVVEVSREVWRRHEDDLREAGDLLYTWQ